MGTSTLAAEQWRRRDTRVSASRALASATRAAIYEHLCDGGQPHTVRDVADRFDLHPNVARTHLELLADAGLLLVGRRKHPGGGRPAKVYRATDGEEPETGAIGGRGSPRLLVKLLAELVDGDRDAGTRAQEAGSVEGRRLVAPLVAEDALDLGIAGKIVVRALRPHVADVRILDDNGQRIDLAGMTTTFELLAAVRPEIADGFQRGLLEGGFAAAGQRVTVSGAGVIDDQERVWRVRPTEGAAGTRSGPPPARRVDARGMPRERGVVRAMREVTGLEPGEVLEILAEGPGSPAAFARWADRAGHQLLGVERAADGDGRPAIRLLIRKGRA